MVYLQSGRRTTGDAELVPRLDFEPTAPDGGFLVFYPIRVERYTWPGYDKQSYSHIAIIGHMLSCGGNGMDIVNAVDDAALNLDGRFNFFNITSKEECLHCPKDPFYPERSLLEGGMQWEGEVQECELYIAVQKGKVLNFGWRKQGSRKWRVYEPPCFESIPY